MELTLTALLGLLVGSALVYWLTQRRFLRTKEALIALEARYEAELRGAEEKLALLEAAREQLKASFQALSAEALSRNNADFLNLAKATLNSYQEGAKGELEKRHEAIQKTVEPVGLALKAFNERVERIEERRTQAEATLREQLRHLADAQQQLSQTTGSLVQALRAPQVRGQWGEMQLRRTVEMAGMVNRVDFLEQASVDAGEGGRFRPDMMIHLPNGRRVVVDSKVPLAAYLDALQSTEPERQRERMQAHARQIRDHIKGLSAKAYWTQFENTPEFVVLFIPNETIFSAALEQDPELIELGVDSKVILATPTTLIALLKAIAFGWQQEAIAREAREISALGKELYERIGVVTGHFAKLGRSLDQSVNHYNRAISSVESRLLVTARKFEALDSASAEPLAEPEPIERQPTLPKEAEEA